MDNWAQLPALPYITHLRVTDISQGIATTVCYWRCHKPWEAIASLGSGLPHYQLIWGRQGLVSRHKWHGSPEAFLLQGSLSHWCHDKDCSIPVHLVSQNFKGLGICETTFNLGKVGQEAQVLWGATGWQAARLHVPCVLGNPAKAQNVKALPPKCTGCIRSSPEIPLLQQLLSTPSTWFSTSKNQTALGFKSAESGCAGLPLLTEGGTFLKSVILQRGAKKAT